MTKFGTPAGDLDGAFFGHGLDALDIIDRIHAVDVFSW